MPFKNPHPLYQVWRSMRARCHDPYFKQWKDYGGRGISICPEWDSFAQFVEDMGPRPDGYTLDRRDNEKGYSPDNCKWSTRKDQQRNRRITTRLTIEGCIYVAADLAEQSGLKTDTIIERARKFTTLAEITSPEHRQDVSGFRLGGKANGARLQARTHCSKGHEYTPENTRITKEGWRNCRRCHAAKMRGYNAHQRTP